MPKGSQLIDFQKDSSYETVMDTSHSSADAAIDTFIDKVYRGQVVPGQLSTKAKLFIIGSFIGTSLQAWTYWDAAGNAFEQASMLKNLNDSAFIAYCQTSSVLANFLLGLATYIDMLVKPNQSSEEAYLKDQALSKMRQAWNKLQVPVKVFLAIATILPFPLIAAVRTEKDGTTSFDMNEFALECFLGSFMFPINYYSINGIINTLEAKLTAGPFEKLHEVVLSLFNRYTMELLNSDKDNATIKSELESLWEKIAGLKVEDPQDSSRYSRLINELLNECSSLSEDTKKAINGAVIDDNTERLLKVITEANKSYIQQQKSEQSHWSLRGMKFLPLFMTQLWQNASISGYAGAAASGLENLSGSSGLGLAAALSVGTVFVYLTIDSTTSVYDSTINLTHDMLLRGLPTRFNWLSNKLGLGKPIPVASQWSKKGTFSKLYPILDNLIAATVAIACLGSFPTNVAVNDNVDNYNYFMGWAKQVVLYQLVYVVARNGFSFISSPVVNGFYGMSIVQSLIGRYITSKNSQSEQAPPETLLAEVKALLNDKARETLNGDHEIAIMQLTRDLEAVIAAVTQASPHARQEIYLSLSEELRSQLAVQSSNQLTIHDLLSKRGNLSENDCREILDMERKPETSLWSRTMTFFGMGSGPAEAAGENRTLLNSDQADYMSGGPSTLTNS